MDIPTAHATNSRAASALRNPLDLAATCAFALASLAYLWTTVAALLNFSVRYPAFDQFRLYPIYLSLPFPDNVIQLENGHRPILPALVRIAEIGCCSADQSLQNAVGLLAILAALALLATVVVRARELPVPSRAAAVAMSVVAVMWLGNARMLMHGNESVHAYFVVVLAVTALLCTYAMSRSGSPWLSCVAAAASATGAMFSFGTGVAVFPAAIALALTLRSRAGHVAFLAAAFLIAWVVYAYVLPGDDGVREQLAFDPLATASALPRWLASPLVRAWLGTGDPPLEQWLRASMASTPQGAPLVASARGIAALIGSDYLYVEGTVVGTLGLGAYAWMLVVGARRGRSLDRLSALGIGLSTFSIIAGAIVCVARVAAFARTPTQVFADRYSPWSCLFWLGLSLFLIASSRARPGFRAATVIATMMVLIIAAPSHRSMAGWSATLHRHVQQSAVAARLGIWDPERFPDNKDATRADVERTLDLMRRDHLSMFAEDVPDQQWRARVGPVSSDGTAAVERRFVDANSGRPIAAISGAMPRTDEGNQAPFLVVVDGSGMQRGLAKFSFIGPNRKSLRFNIAHKRGFDGYVVDPQPGEHFWILAMDRRFRHTVAAVALEAPQDR